MLDVLPASDDPRTSWFFHMGKTLILSKDPTTWYVYERAQNFLQNNPDLQVIANDFTQEMFTVQGIEVLGSLWAQISTSGTSWFKTTQR